MSSPSAARVLRRSRLHRDWNALLRRLRGWRKRARWAWRTLSAAPPAVRLVALAAAALAVFAATNLLYQVVRKPTEVFFPVRGVLKKMPREVFARCDGAGVPRRGARGGREPAAEAGSRPRRAPRRRGPGQALRAPRVPTAARRALRRPRRRHISRPSQCDEAAVPALCR